VLFDQIDFVAIEERSTARRPVSRSVCQADQDFGIGMYLTTPVLTAKLHSKFSSTDIMPAALSCCGELRSALSGLERTAMITD
jgi:hypothetical protein